MTKIITVDTEEETRDNKHLILNLIKSQLGSLFFIDEFQDIFKKGSFKTLWTVDEVGHICFKDEGIILLKINENYFEEIKKIFSNFNSEAIIELIIEKGINIRRILLK